MKSNKRMTTRAPQCQDAREKRCYGLPLVNPVACEATVCIIANKLHQWCASDQNWDALFPQKDVCPRTYVNRRPPMLR